MRKQLAVMAALVALLAACTEESPDGPAPPCRDPVHEGSVRGAVAGFSGSTAVSTGGAMDCLVASGSADEKTPNMITTTFDIGSMTKAFTAAAVLALADEGQLKLDDKAGDLLPELRPGRRRFASCCCTPAG